MYADNDDDDDNHGICTDLVSYHRGPSAYLHT